MRTGAYAAGGPPAAPARRSGILGAATRTLLPALPLALPLQARSHRWKEGEALPDLRLPTIDGSRWINLSVLGGRRHLWRAALDADPEQYNRRRRIHPYGPRMNKPYAFYDRVAEARTAIRARGEEPIPLAAQLTPVEQAQKRRFEPAGEQPEPDPEGRIPRDAEDRIAIESAVAFDTSGQSRVASLHLALRPNAELDVHFDDEAGPVVVWLGSPALPGGLELDARRLELRPAASGRASDVRRLAADLRLPEGSRAGTLRGYALFFACAGVDGERRHLRRDFEVEIPAPR